MSSEYPYTLRVRYGDTDQMGVAYYANYLYWFEVGRTEFCRAHGKSYADWEGEGIFLPVVESHCRYKHPARYEDEITIFTKIGEVKASSVIFECRIERVSDGKPLASGWTRHAFVDRSGRLLRGDNPLRRWIEALAG
ncbi:thioesterase family protein [Aminivibrio sp.]|uniref:acyl-CoA thioesterase n=1 Tax=Aminivibrio sp. TaxID=1872489 RepID=UPI001A4703D6|nr:thioesterase family protein [Aminivibrio sp.]MBL3540733.1 acyl-CoA thioesterase [Aminivibrio sp.]